MIGRGPGASWPVLAILLVLAPTVCGQALQDQLDEQRFLQGLADLGLREALDHHVRTNPPADEIEAVLYRMADRRMTLRSPAVPMATRIRALEELLDLRRSLIDGHRDHPERHRWLLDQAEDLLFELLPAEGSGFTVLFGLPTPRQHERARDVARRLPPLTSTAGLELDRRLQTLGLEAETSSDAWLERRREWLKENERGRRLPFLRGVGLFLHATLVGGDGDLSAETMWRRAADELEPLAGRLSGELAARASLYAALAAVRLDERERARRLLQVTIDAEGTSSSDLLAARLAMLEIEASARPDPTGETLERSLRRLDGDYLAPQDLFFRLIIRDRLFMARRDAARVADSAARERALAEAFDAYLELLEDSKAAGSPRLRDAMLEKLSIAADEQAPLALLPPVVTVARAGGLARATRYGEAIDLYRSVLGDNELPPVLHAAALFGLARASYDAGRFAGAIESFTQLADSFATDPRSESAIELAAALGARQYREAPDDAAVRRRLDRSLGVLLARYPNLESVDRWRYLAGRIALQERRIDDARTHFSRVARDAEQWLDAQFMG
ncbi:MAG: hypothetical protein ACYTGC_14595, partial [Planctomycetota bacterium]